MPHWWIRILSSPPQERLREVREIIADYPPARLVDETILYEEGVTRFAWAMVDVPDDFDRTPQLLDALKTVGSKRLNRAERQNEIFPDRRTDDPEEPPPASAA